MRDLMCSSHTVSGVLPGSPSAARHGLAERLGACAVAGYVGCWLHYRDYLEQRVAGLADDDIRTLFDRFGMRHRGVEFLTDWFVDHEDCRAAETAAFAAARAIGATVLNVGSDFAGRGLSKALMVDRFVSLCSRAADTGISVAIEFVPWSNVPDIRAALDFMGPQNAGIVVDCWHLFRGEVPLSDIALVPAEKILCIQLSDAPAVPRDALPEETLNRLPCGEGALDLAGFMEAVDRTAPDVPVSVEIISPRFAGLPVAEAAAASIRGLRELLLRQGARSA